jgi:dihydrofolate reductase
MRRIIVTEFLTLDGIMEAPNEWSLQYWTDEIARYKYNELFASDALLLGRVTYQGFAAAWPSMKDEEGFADRMNNLPKFVVSTTLKNVEWNNSKLINGNVAEEVSRLKEQSGQDILIAGSADLIHTLMPCDLIDEYRLLVYPILVGSGKRLFTNENRAALKLVETQSFSSGTVLLRYQADK